MKKFSFLPGLSLLLSLALLLPGCGDESAIQSSDSSPMPAASTPSATQPRLTTPAASYPAVPSESDRMSSHSETSGTTPVTTVTTDHPITTAADPNFSDLPTSVSPDVDQAPFTAVRSNAEYVLLFDETDERLLYLKGGMEDRIYPASITKLITVLYGLTILDDPETVFTIGEEIQWIGPHSSVADVKIGEQYTAFDLMACMLLRSGNDTAYSFATECGLLLAGDREVSRREALDLFLAGMNEYAQDVLGLTASHFESPDGFHSDGHYTTLRDLLIITRAAYGNPIIRTLTAMTEYSAVTVDGSRTLELKSTNMMLYEDSPYYCPYVNGLKTGNTDMAGSCVAVSAERDGHVLILLLMKSNDIKDKFREALDYIEAGYGMLEEQSLPK